MRAKLTWVVIAVFVVTRIALVFLAMRPDVYTTHDGINTASDVDLYEGWAVEMVDDGEAAYSNVEIEYPPGSLPFILVPEVVNGNTSYLVVFVTMMLLVDIAGFAGLTILSKRWGSPLGMMVWTLAVAALGPIAYLRLDLAPAVATIWAFERASAKDWMGTGGWMGIGAIVKLYPLLFVPAGLLLAAQRRRFAIATALVFVAPLLPLIPAIGDVMDSVLGYHGDRGVQIESMWGAILFIAQRSGALVYVGFNFGALHFGGELSETLKNVATYASLGGLALGTALVFFVRDRDRGKAYAEISFVILALALTTGTVFSPQFLLWLIAIGGAVASTTDSRLRFMPIALIPIGLITQVIFPFNYNNLIYNETLPLVLLWIRNIVVLGMGLGGVFLLWRGYRRAAVSAPSTPALASE